jgi:hypothetical protein
VGPPGSYSNAFRRAAARWEHERVIPLKLPAQPWRTTRFENGDVERLYGEPKQEAHASDVTAITRDADGVLMRHATYVYTHKRVHGTLLNACLNPTADELAVLMRFNDVPEGPQLRSHTRIEPHLLAPHPR